VASYLDPKPIDIKIIEAIRYQYPLSVRRAMLNIQLNTKRSFRPFKKREITETCELYNKGQSQNSAHAHNDSRFESTRYLRGQNQDQVQIRRIQYQQNPVSDNYCRQPRRNFYGVERGNVMSNARSSINDT
jgi:hypothetical protein